MKDNNRLASRNNGKYYTVKPMKFSVQQEVATLPKVTPSIKFAVPIIHLGGERRRDRESQVSGSGTQSNVPGQGSESLDPEMKVLTMRPTRLSAINNFI